MMPDSGISWRKRKPLSCQNSFTSGHSFSGGAFLDLLEEMKGLFRDFSFLRTIERNAGR
jgi:hypothetical protein